MTPALLLATSLQVWFAVAESAPVDSLAVTIAVTGQPTQRKLVAGGHCMIAFAAQAPGTTVTISATPTAYRGAHVVPGLTVTRTRSEPLADVIGGLAFGLTDLKANGYRAPFTLSRDSYNALTIVSDLAAAKAAKMRVMLALTGGSHAQYLTNGVFDPAKWGAKLQTFNTPAIRAAIAAQVSDGTIVGAEVMDEPNVSGAGDGNTWGPVGTMTKARVDSLCGAVKQMFPTLPAGVTHDYAVFEPAKSYRVCDFLETQWSAKDGAVATYRDAALAMGARDHHAILFGMNLLNGGVADRDSLYSCDGPGQAGFGTISPNCRMSATDVRNAGLALFPRGCGGLMWRFDLDFISRADNKTSFQSISDSLARVPHKDCRRGQ